MGITQVSQYNVNADCYVLWLTSTSVMWHDKLTIYLRVPWLISVFVAFRFAAGFLNTVNLRSFWRFVQDVKLLLRKWTPDTWKQVYSASWCLPCRNEPKEQDYSCHRWWAQKDHQKHVLSEKMIQQPDCEAVATATLRQAKHMVYDRVSIFFDNIINMLCSCSMCVWHTFPYHLTNVIAFFRSYSVIVSGCLHYSGVFDWKNLRVSKETVSTYVTVIAVIPQIYFSEEELVLFERQQRKRTSRFSNIDIFNTMF